MIHAFLPGGALSSWRRLNLPVLFATHILQTLFNSLEWTQFSICLRVEFCHTLLDVIKIYFELMESWIVSLKVDAFNLILLIRSASTGFSRMFWSVSRKVEMYVSICIWNSELICLAALNAFCSFSFVFSFSRNGINNVYHIWELSTRKTLSSAL